MVISLNELNIYLDEFNMSPIMSIIIERYFLGIILLMYKNNQLEISLNQLEISNLFLNI